MITAEFPLFELKKSKETLFACGGGGNLEYGKRNGILAYSIKTLTDSEKKPAFYSTLNFISRIELFYDPVSSDKEVVYIAAASEKTFLFLKFVNNDFTLLKRIDKKVKMYKNKSDLYLINEGKAYLFDKVISNYDKIEFEDNYLVSNENDWANLFVFNDSVIKVINNKNEPEFSIAENKYKLPKLPNLFSSEDSVCYFYNTNEGILTLIGEVNKIIKLPRITAIKQSKNLVFVSTCNGNINIIKNGILISSEKVSVMPITSIEILNDDVIFTTLTGEIMTYHPGKSKRWIWFFMILFIGILVGYMKLNKKADRL